MPGPRPSQPLRVAMIVPPYFTVPPDGYGGVEAVAATLADALAGNGHEVTLIGAGQAETSASFVPVWDQPVPGRLGEVFPEVMHAAAARRAVQQIAAADGLDVVHDHTLAGPLNAPAYTALGLPTVVTVHGPVTGDLRRLYRELGDDVCLVAISSRQRELAPELNWVATVPNGLSIGDWPYQEDKDEYALFLGRFHPDKAPHLALDAAHAAGIPLILAGKCTEPVEKAYFEKMVRPRLGPADQVLGVADAVLKRTLLARARCLLFPACWEEPFGMVLIEAMACGTPVVALRAGAVPEIVRDGVTGLICHTPAELPGALHEVKAIDPAACRAHVAAHFSAARLRSGYETAYRRVIQAAVTRVRQPAAVEMLRCDFPELGQALEQRASQAPGRPGLVSGHSLA